MNTSNQVPILRLLNGNPNDHIQRPQPTYSITVRQQPLSARACGFSERDRRVIDPPPILVLEVNEPEASSEELTERLRSPLYVVYCSLWNPRSDEEDNIMPTTSRLPQRRLIGTPVGSHFYGRDNLDREQCFFYFADLSVRTAGTYCLRFELVVLDAWRMVTRESLAVAATVKSNVFTVYNAKDFQGMRPSTELTRCLRAQGCLIPVKKGSAKANTSSLEEGSDDERDCESGSSVGDEKQKVAGRG